MINSKIIQRLMQPLRDVGQASDDDPYPIYKAKVGLFGSVTFFREQKSDTYCFAFFNGEDYSPLYLSRDAAYYVWAFIGMEHPDATISTFTPPKKAGRSKPKKQPSKPTKKKAKSK